MALIIRDLGRQPYLPIWRAMQRFTDWRTAQTADEIWLLQHDPVYTQGMAGKPEHVLNSADIPIVAIDRGGQVTYHGPGQLVIYFLLDIRRRALTPRQLVSLIECYLVDLLAQWQITATAKKAAPGIYVDQAKIASIGLRVRKGACYHGAALNVAMDLSPFLGINPCGYKALKMTQMTDCLAAENAKILSEKSPMTLTRVKQHAQLLLKKYFNEIKP
jgi:lipoyl(octanoyl) transferase